MTNKENASSSANAGGQDSQIGKGGVKNYSKQLPSLSSVPTTSLGKN